MQTANVMVALGGDMGTTVPKYRVTASEIAVLRALHGPEAVFDIEPTDDIEVSSRDEIRRLAEPFNYGRSKVEDGNGGSVPVVTALFPGSGARAIMTLAELEIDESFYKAERRMAPKPAAPAKKGRGKKAEAEAEEEKADADDSEDDAQEKLFD